jgi:quercetin dioxygenase-like cupin family protein
MELENGILRASDVPIADTGHSQVQFVATPQRTGSEAMCILRGTLPAGGAVHLHSHADPESFYLLAGEMELYRDDGEKAGWSRVQMGDLAVIRSEVKHAWRNSSSEPCVAIIFTGGDVCRFLQEVTQLMSSLTVPGPPTPEMAAAIHELARKYHCWNATPEENRSIGLDLF